MGDKELTKILSLHLDWLQCNGGERADLRNADLHNANLRNADLHNANLRNADLHNADLSGANLRNADLRNADLHNADLSGANLRNANLRNADLRNADLSGADLRNADLHNADLRDADLDYSCLPLWCGSLLVNMDDRQVKQLLYHTLSVVKNSNNVSEDLKEKLLTNENLKIAKEFHRERECNKL